jgi:F-type H+-transporting ATPase subunit b
MTIDLWGLGLQAVNVLILVWLLSRFFWRPVAAAIAARQDAAGLIMEEAKATQGKADAALVQVSQARAGIAAERDVTLAAATNDANIAAKIVLTDAHEQADTLLATAKKTILKDTLTAQKANGAQAAELSFKIAKKCLERLNGADVQTAFLAQLVTAISGMPAADRETLSIDPAGIDIVTAADFGPDKTASKTTIKKAVRDALGGTPDLRFVVDADLIAGFELRSPHFVLRNSWQADLIQVQKALNDGP